MKSLLTILLFTPFILPVRSLAQITAAENGLTKEVGSTDVLVKLGGTLYNSQTSIDFGSGSSSALLFKKGSSNYFYLGNNGNIGIGTNSPSAKLHLAGTFMLVDGSQGNGKVLTSDANGVASWQTPSGGGGSSQWTTATNDIYNNNSGNVGIGTSTPGVKFDVSGAVRSNTSISVVNTYGATWDVYGTHARFAANSSTDAITIVTSKSTSSIRLQVNNGNRGVIMDGSNTNFLFMGGSGETLSGIGNANGTGHLTLLYSTGANSQTEGARLSSSGNFGIGTNNPQSKLHVAGTFRLVDGTQAAGKVLTSDANGVATWQTPSGGGGGGYWTDAGSGNLYNTTQAGTVAIGLTTVPSGYKLAVAGNIIAEKVKTKLQASGWPDFVFQPGYNLPSLKEVEQFIKENNHLPGVPSSKEIEKNGLDLGDGQATLLKKVEELTLYMIEMNKQVEKLNEENKELKKQMAGKK